MLRETKIEKTRKGYERWFRDEGPYFENLVIWYNRKFNEKDSDNLKNLESITGFQLTYRKDENSCALTWHKGEGVGIYSHDGVDDGEYQGLPKMSRVLIADGLFDNKTTAEKFSSAAALLNRELVNYICDRLLAYPGGLESASSAVSPVP